MYSVHIVYDTKYLCAHSLLSLLYLRQKVIKNYFTVLSFHFNKCLSS